MLGSPSEKLDCHELICPPGSVQAIIIIAKQWNRKQRKAQEKSKTNFKVISYRYMSWLPYV